VIDGVVEGALQAVSAEAASGAVRVIDIVSHRAAGRAVTTTVGEN